MGLKLPGLAAVLVSAIFGGIAYALPAEDHPVLKTGALVLSGLAFVALVVLLIIAYRRRGKSQDAEPARDPRIRAKDSPGWIFKRTHAPGDQPFADVDNSPDWSFEDSTIGGDDTPEEGQPDPPREGG